MAEQIVEEDTLAALEQAVIKALSYRAFMLLSITGLGLPVWVKQKLDEEAE